MNLDKHILTFLFHFLHAHQIVERRNFVSLFRTEVADYCVTNSSSAIFYTTEDGSIYEGTNIYPSFHMHKMDQNDHWKIVESLNSDSLPVLDHRWEDLTTNMMTRLHLKNNEMLYFAHLVNFDSQNLQNSNITISLKAKEVEFFYCSGRDVSKSYCYWFILHANRDVVLRKCEKQIPINTIDTPRYPCRKPLQTKKLIGPYLSKTNWTHIVLEKKNNYFSLKTINDGQQKTFFDYYDREPPFFEIKYILMHTKDDKAFYKLHNYEYLRTNNEKDILFGKPIPVINRRVCFSFFLTSCAECEVILYLEKQLGNQKQIVRTLKPLPPSTGIWKHYKMSISIDDNIDKIYIRIDAVLAKTVERISNKFWAVDSFRQCVEEEYRVSKSHNDVRLKSCQLVSSNDKVEWNITQCEQITWELSKLYGKLCNNQRPFGKECTIRQVCEIRNELENCYCFSDGGSKKASAPYDVRLVWNKNNTFQLFWKHMSCESMIFQINITSGHTILFSLPHIFNGLNCKREHHLEVKDRIPPAVDISIEIYVEIEGQKKFVRTTEFSYPAVPVLTNSNITILDETNTTIRISLNITEKDKSIKTIFKYLLILIKERNSKIPYTDTISLRKILNETTKLTDFMKVITEIDLSQYNSKVLNFTIGNGSTARSNLLNKMIKNSPLITRQLSEIIVLMINQYKNKYSSQLYSLLLKKHGFDGKLSTEDYQNKDGSFEFGVYVVLFLLLTVILVVGILVIIRKRTIKTNSSISLAMIMNEFDEIQLSNENEEENYKNVTQQTHIKGKLGVLMSTDPPNRSKHIHTKKIKLSDFKEYVRKSIKEKELDRQHQLLPRGQTQPWEYGSLYLNRHKNRYTNLITYDHSRVMLEKIPGDEYSDYINASYIHGYTVPKAYIATQGPKYETLGDFWRMIWQENVNHIIMIANIIEEGKENVHQYWPTKGDLIFQGTRVQIISVKVYADFEHRIFRVTRGHETRKLEQIHFTGWPDPGIPLYAHTLRPFVEKILKIPLMSSSPIVVHCSAGVGRTGTILLIDICLRMAANEGIVDFLGILQKLRQQRPNLVDNEEQYKLAHLVVLDNLMGLRTGIPCNELDKEVEKLLRSEDYVKTQIHYLSEAEWEDQAMKSVGGTSEKYIIYSEKNRLHTIIPEKQRRIVLTRYPSDDATSAYINAVRVDGIKCPEKFIVTQQPMPNTVGDFWRLILEMRSQMIISLNEINSEDETCCKFWPTAEEPKLHPVDFVVVVFEKLESFSHYDLYSLEMVVTQGKRNNIKIKVIAFKGWKAKANLPTSCQDFFNFWEKVNDITRGLQNIIITCYDGATASGVFVALSYVIEKMRLEKEFDLCSAVRNVRHNRKQFVTNSNQFIFIYEAALIYTTKSVSYNTD